MFQDLKKYTWSYAHSFEANNPEWLDGEKSISWAYPRSKMVLIEMVILVQS